MGYLVNEASGAFRQFPNTNVKVDEAESYEEVGSFTVFKDGSGNEVFSMKTEDVKTIRNV